MRGREPVDERTQLGFCRSSRHRRLGAAGDLDFDLDGTAAGGFFLHAHDGSLGSDFCGSGCATTKKGKGASVHFAFIAAVMYAGPFCLPPFACRRSVPATAAVRCRRNDVRHLDDAVEFGAGRLNIASGGRSAHTTATFTQWIGGSAANRHSHFSPPSRPIHNWPVVVPMYSAGDFSSSTSSPSRSTVK